MYFHPLILTEAQKQQRVAAYQDFARLCLDGIDRQHRLHMQAVAEFGARQQENLRKLSEALDITQFLVRWSASAAPAPLELFRVSLRSGEIVADVQRQIAALADVHTKELWRSMLGHEVAKDTSARRDQNGQGKARRRRVIG